MLIVFNIKWLNRPFKSLATILLKNIGDKFSVLHFSFWMLTNTGPGFKNLVIHRNRKGGIHTLLKINVNILTKPSQCFFLWWIGCEIYYFYPYVASPQWVWALTKKTTSLHKRQKMEGMILCFPYNRQLWQKKW